jgi:flagellar hook-associated protein 1 FlgK
MLSLSSSAISNYGGVQVDGITRLVDEGLASDKRLATAESGMFQASVDFLSKFEAAVGTPDELGSISAQLANFENSLIAAASRPDATDRLGDTVISARQLASALNRASDTVQDARSQADRNIATQVEDLNMSLEQVKTLNSQITALQSQGGSSAALQDQRQIVVDHIASIVPVRNVPRDNGQIALYSTGGAVLLDGTAAVIEFAPVNVVTPYMRIEDATLSGLTLNGTPLATGSENGRLRGGTLGAQFTIRDEQGIAAQDQLDAVARDLIERFQQPAVDPSLGAGDAGIFTDEGNAFDPADEIGIAQRLQLNARVDPDQGGETWRIRDGINAATPGEAGEASLIIALQDALTIARLPGSAGFGSRALSANDLLQEVSSSAGLEWRRAEQNLVFTNTRLEELTARQLSDGVDTDEEIQRLIVIEQSYAANARMIEVVDDLMQTLLRI